MMNQMDMVKQAFSNGSYAMAYEGCVGLIRNGSADGMTYMCRAMAKIAKEDIDSIDIEEARADLIYSCERINNDAQTPDEYFENAAYTLFMRVRARNKIEEKHKDRLSALQNQFQGSAGVSFSSDDPAEKQREQAQRDHNNAINRQIYRLNEKKADLLRALDEILVQCILTSAWLQETPGIVPLKLLNALQNAGESVSDQVKAETNKFVKLAKAERNRIYWEDHAERYNALLAEKKKLEQKVVETIQEELTKGELAIKRAMEAKERAIKERRRYSLFNFADRNPQTAIIVKARAVIKRAKELEKELQAGNCPLCDSDKERIAEINEELHKQR